jgi:PAS domain S-box-containing protein
MGKTQDKSRATKKPAIEEIRPKEGPQPSAYQQLQARQHQLKTALEQLRASEQQLKAANKQLRLREHQLEKANIQLKAVNQQLRAHEQQLQAANRQLRAREQQLHAANQQLRAHEQQLEAGNQQLQAREQQLQAANQQLRAHEQQLRAREQQLYQERNTLRTLIDNLPDFIYIKDPQSRFVACNAAVSNFMGAAKPEQLIGRTDFDFYPHDRAAEFFADEQHIIQAGQPLINKNEPNAGQTGKLRWILTTKLPLRDDRGKVVGIVGISRDVTQAKEDEQHLHQAKQAAESANKAKSQFLANISHEIRTPLNAIIGVSKTLGKHDPENLTAKQLEGLDIVNRSSQRLLMLIHGVLDLSKIESGKIELALRPFSLDVLIAGVKSVAKTLSDKPEVNFVVQKAATLPETVVSDAHKLHEILTNIISNAFKFTNRGQVVLSIYDKENRLYFEVSDTGIGITEKDRDRIFEEFTQLDSSTTRKYQGTGLGLTISKKLVEMLGGQIGVESTLGEGTTISFYVPLKTPQQKAAAEELTEAKEHHTDVTKQAVHAPSASPEQQFLPKVLVAEDDEFSRAAIKLMLENRYELIFAEDGNEAVDKYFEANPDAVLMDIMMPVVDGYEAFDRIRKKATGPTVPVIALTAKAMKDDRDELLAFGFTDYIPKPIDDEALIRTIDKHLKKRRQ